MRTVELKTSQLSTGGSRLQITVRHTASAVVDAAIRATGSRLIYRTKFCKKIALLGHSFGAIIATYHATELGTAAAYVISAGGDSSASLDADVAAALEALGDDGKVIAQSWEDEKTVETDEQFKQLLRDQLPFHFHGQAPPGYGEEAVPSPEVLRHFANAGYGDFDYGPKLNDVEKPALVIVGEYDRTTTPRAARVLYEGIPRSELVVVPEAGHLSFVEQTDDYLSAVRNFLAQAT